MTVQLSASEARARLPELLKAAHTTGQVTIITLSGIPVAQIGPLSQIHAPPGPLASTATQQARRDEMLRKINRK